MTNKEVKRKLNHLERVAKILEEFKKHKDLDIPNTIIWRKHIYPQFFISFSTLNKYLSINISQEKLKLKKACEQA